MRKPDRRAALIVFLVLTGLLLAAHLFAANLLKPRLEQLVETRTQRHLGIGGDLRLILFPRPALALARLTLSERGREGEFATVEGLRLGLAFWPLLRGEVVLTELEVTGLRAHLVRFADGRTNFDDLFAREKTPAFRFDPRRLQVTGRLDFEDRQRGRRAITDFTFAAARPGGKTASTLTFQGRLNLDSPPTALAFKGTGRAELNVAEKRLAWQELALEAKGEVPGGRRVEVTGRGDGEAAWPPLTLRVENLTVRARMEEEGQTAELNLALPRLSLTGQKLEVRQASGTLTAARGMARLSAALSLPELVGGGEKLTARLKLEAEGRHTAGHFTLRLATPLEVLPATGRLVASAVVGEVTLDAPPLPRTLRLALSGCAAGARDAIGARFVARGEGTTAHVQLTLLPGRSPWLVFDARLDRLTLQSPRAAGEAARHPFELSRLGALPIDGRLRVGSLNLDGFHAKDVVLRLGPQGEEAGREGPGLWAQGEPCP
ncbi:MAG: AsmA family protein [Burkholderiales bacterium]|nr:AsmA family protein [Burkholderiales bacterium]